MIQRGEVIVDGQLHEFKHGIKSKDGKFMKFLHTRNLVNGRVIRYEEEIPPNPNTRFLDVPTFLPIHVADVEKIIREKNELRLLEATNREFKNYRKWLKSLKKKESKNEQ